MPCYDPPQHVRDETERENYRHNSDVADLLCSVLRLIDSGETWSVPQNVRVWWEEHKERDFRKQMGDRIRAEADAERAAAIAALSPEQRAELIRTKVISQEEADARV